MNFFCFHCICNKNINGDKMKRYENMTLTKFHNYFKDEESCWKHLFDLRWSEGFICPKCGNNRYYFISTRKLCECSSCKHQVSLTAGTIFHNSRTPLLKWFLMILLITNQKTGQSIKTLQKILEIKQYRTAWLMAHKIRHVMKERNSKYFLSGLVELDDGFLGSPKEGKTGRGAEGKTTLLIGIEKDNLGKPGRGFISIIPDMMKVTVKKTIEEHIKNETEILTDGYSTYKSLKKEGYSITNIVIGNPKEASQILPWVHKTLSNVKAIIRGVHKGVKKKYLSQYLAEFAYKLNRRWKTEIIFCRFVYAGLLTKAITLPELTT